MDINVERIDFNTICRICLKNETFLNNLYETDASDMLKFCGFLEVEKCDNLPDNICSSCNGILIQSYKLKQLCTSSHLYLQTLLANRGNMADSSADLDCDSKLEKVSKMAESETSRNNEFVYECSDCGDQDISKGHCCNAEQNISNDCDLSDSEKVFQPKNAFQADLSDVSEARSNVKLKCPKCMVTFEHRQDAFLHQSIHEGDELACNACKKTFKTLKVLKRHLKTHMIAKSHTCKICSKGFAESSDVIKHEKRFHLGIPREKNYGCNECGQRFTDQYYLKVHQRKHTGEKPLRCDICERSFYDPRSLRVHLNAHKGLKPYLCNYCGKSFLQNGHLKQHIIVHTTEKPYSCTICEKRFTQSTSLQRHQKVHEETYKCDFCSNGFSKIHQLYRHKEEEHGVKRKIERRRINVLKGTDTIMSNKIQRMDISDDGNCSSWEETFIKDIQDRPALYPLYLVNPTCKVLQTMDVLRYPLPS